MKAKKSAEKEWLRRLGTPQHIDTHTADEARRPPKPAAIEQRHDKPRPSDKQKGFCDVAGMDDLKRLVTEGFINVLKNPEYAAAYNITPPSLLFYGPAGCGKTFFAEKIAEEVGINFMKIVPDDIASTLVHGTQEKVGQLFRKAESKAPTLIFFDEFDAMVPRRTNDDRGYQNGEVNEFLAMLNNASARGIYILAATNHPERIDKAILRTGRIDELIYIDMPDTEARESLFKLSLSKLPTDTDIDFHRLAEMTRGYNCSDISYIVKTASRKMFNATIADENGHRQPITQKLLEDIIAAKAPSVSSKDLREFERLRNEFSPLDTNARHNDIGFHI
jgi:transitional endoplasmic reticulum ATPase